MGIDAQTRIKQPRPLSMSSPSIAQRTLECGGARLHVHQAGVRRAAVVIAAVLATVAVGCGGSSAPPKDPSAAPKSTPTSLTCPALQTTASRELAGLFGIDQGLASRVARTVALTAELERSAKALDAESREICSLVARDLAPVGAPPIASAGSRHPCEIAVERLAAARTSLGGMTMSIANVSCGVPKDAIARCAGECITGRADVVSAVSCSGADGCGLDFTLPDASPSCVTQCGARALREVRCSATIDVRTSDPRWTPERIEALRTTLPRLAAFGASMGPRAVELGKQVEGIVDALAENIDELTASKSAGRVQRSEIIDRRIVVGSVLAGCVAPALADTLRASGSLSGSVRGALELHGALAAR